MMMMWMQQQVFNYRVVSLLFLSYHTYRYLAGEMRKEKNDTLGHSSASQGSLSPGWLFHEKLFDSVCHCSSSKNIEKQFFFFFFVRVVRWHSLFAHFFFCFFSTEKVEIRRTNKKKGPSGENELNLSLDATAGFYFFISFKIIVSY